MIARTSNVLFAALLLGACAQPQPAQAPSKSPSIGNPQAMAAAQAAMGMQATDHPGKAIYDRTCAACHNNPEATRSPSLETLKAMRYQTISYALTQGKMQAQALGAERAGTLGRDRLPGRPRGDPRRLDREGDVPGEPRQARSQRRADA